MIASLRGLPPKRRWETAQTGDHLAMVLLGVVHRWPGRGRRAAENSLEYVGMILGEWVARASLVPLLVALAACSGGSSAGAPPSVTSAPATSAATSAPVTLSVSSGTTASSPTASVGLPALPEAAKHPTREGAEAFFTYFLALYTASYASLNADELEAISLPSCKFCFSAVSDIREAKKAGNRPVGGEVKPIVVVAAPGDPVVGMLVNSAIQQNSGTTYGPSGVVLATAAAHANLAVDAAVRWVNGKWVVAVVRVK
jgi:hypothetical protein